MDDAPKFYVSVSRRRGILINRQWFMQYDIIHHIANACFDRMAQKFGDRVIFRRKNKTALFADLNPCDFFPLGSCKRQCLCCNPATLQNIKTAIPRFIRPIPVDICKRAIGNFEVRLNEFLTAEVKSTSCEIQGFKKSS